MQAPQLPLTREPIEWWECKELTAFISFCTGIFTFLRYLKNYFSYSALKNLKSIFKERLNCHNRYSINKTTLCLGACVSSMKNHVIPHLLIHYGSVNQNDHMIAYLLILLSLVITNGLVAYWNSISCPKRNHYHLKKVDHNYFLIHVSHVNCNKAAQKLYT